MIDPVIQSKFCQNKSIKIPENFHVHFIRVYKKERCVNVITSVIMMAIANPLIYFGNVFLALLDERAFS